MARERYLLDTEESSIHSNVITVDTKKEKFKNWWYYSKMKLLIIAIVIACVGSLLYSIFSKVEADYTIAFVYGNYIEDGLLDELESQLELYADDRNGDGQVVVEIMNYSLTTDLEESYDVYAEQAASVQFMADLSTGDSMIWIHDASGWASLGEDTDEVFIEVDDDDDSTMMMFNDVQAFEDLDFSVYVGEYYTGSDVEYFFDDLRVSFRTYYGAIAEKDKMLDYYESSEVFFENLINGTIVSPDANTETE